MFRRFPALLIVFTITTVLAACKTAEDFYGSGPITLAPTVKEFVDKYIKVGQTNVVAVRTDGRYAYVSYCGALACSGGGEENDALYGCESKGGKCWIYAMNGYVVWKGPVSVAGRGRTTGAKRRGGMGDYAYYTDEITDEIVCQLAIDQSEHTPKWGDNRYVRYVLEAKRRGLTVADCLKYLNK